MNQYNKYPREYDGISAFTCGDLVINKNYTPDMINIMVIQRVRPGRNCVYYYTVYPFTPGQIASEFLSITDNREGNFMKVSNEFLIEHAEQFI